MDSQLQSSESSYSTNAEMAEMPEPNRLTTQSPVDQSLQKGQWIVNQSTAFISQLFNAVGRLFQENKTFVSLGVLLIAAFIALRILFAILDAIDDIPLFPLVFELVGIGYSVWFVNRYLLKTSNRQELSRDLQSLKQQIFGDQQLSMRSSINSTSGSAASLQSSARQSSTSQSGASQDARSATALDVKKSVLIAKSPEELYHFWRNFENLPHFMNHLESVSMLDQKRSHWVAKAPLDTSVEWDAEIIQEEEPRTIVWRSIGGSDVDNVGSVAFIPANGNGTEVRVTMEYVPPGGVVGAAVAAVFGENPEQQLEEDLNRFKQLMETGSVPTAT